MKSGVRYGHLTLAKLSQEEVNPRPVAKIYLVCQQNEETPGDNEEDDEGGDPENAEGTTVFVKNLNFDTTEETLKEVTSISVHPLITAFVRCFLSVCTDNSILETMLISCFVKSRLNQFSVKYSNCLEVLFVVDNLAVLKQNTLRMFWTNSLPLIIMFVNVAVIMQSIIEFLMFTSSSSLNRSHIYCKFHVPG